MYHRILVKLSGEALSGEGKNGILDSEALLNTCRSIKAIYDEGVQVSIVIGAGNICRGGLIAETGFDRVTGDYMGMLGTIINSFAIKETLIKLGAKSIVLSGVKVEEFTPSYSPELADKYLNDGYVVIFGGGTGKPYFTTDTCATMRAIETKCDAILIAKNGVEGIYDDDPRYNKNAKLYKEVNCSTILEKKLKVMDLTAVEMLIDKNIDVCVFNAQNTDNFVKVARGERLGTVVKKG